MTTVSAVTYATDALGITDQTSYLLLDLRDLDLLFFKVLSLVCVSKIFTSSNQASHPLKCGKALLKGNKCNALVLCWMYRPQPKATFKPEKLSLHTFIM